MSNRPLRGSIALPRQVSRPAQTVLVVRADMPLDKVGHLGPLHLDRVLGHLASEGAAPFGLPFFRYDVIDMAGTMSMSFGVPVAPGIAGAPGFEVDTLPAGDYVSVTHHGDPDEIYDVMVMLGAWVRDRGLAYDSVVVPSGERFAARLEIFHADPTTPRADWTTEILVRLRD
jgi:hypothetical protein